MKIVLQYREPGTKIKGCYFTAVYEEEEIEEAMEELKGAKAIGYEITVWKILHAKDLPDFLNRIM